MDINKLPEAIALMDKLIKLEVEKIGTLRKLKRCYQYIHFAGQMIHGQPNWTFKPWINDRGAPWQITTKRLLATEATLIVNGEEIRTAPLSEVPEEILPEHVRKLLSECHARDARRAKAAEQQKARIEREKKIYGGQLR